MDEKRRNQDIEKLKRLKTYKKQKHWDEKEMGQRGTLGAIDYDDDGEDHDFSFGDSDSEEDAKKDYKKDKKDKKTLVD